MLKFSLGPIFSHTKCAFIVRSLPLPSKTAFHGRLKPAIVSRRRSGILQQADFAIATRLHTVPTFPHLRSQRAEVTARGKKISSSPPPSPALFKMDHKKCVLHAQSRFPPDFQGAKPDGLSP